MRFRDALRKHGALWFVLALVTYFFVSVAMAFSMPVTTPLLARLAAIGGYAWLPLAPAGPFLGLGLVGALAYAVWYLGFAGEIYRRTRVSRGFFWFHDIHEMGIPAVIVALTMSLPTFISWAVRP